MTERGSLDVTGALAQPLPMSLAAASAHVPLVAALLIATVSAAAFAGCNGSDACGCLCDGPPDGSILAPCSSGVIDESDGAMPAEPDASAE